MLNRPYKFNFSKLFRANNSEDFNVETLKQNKAFFCSELVASVYKNMGLILPDKSASSFLPGQFQEKNKI